MKKIVIVYFSGTGKTELVSSLIQKRFLKAGFETETHCIIHPEELSKIDFKGKILGIGFPVYTFVYPQIIHHFYREPHI